MRTVDKSNFAELVNYLTDPQSKEHRLGQVQMTNCIASTLLDASAEVLATQHLNTRAKTDKTYHLILSFRANEQPSAEILHAIEERICAGLGYADHQRISVVHNDTDNLHVHLAINKIHPARHTIHEPYYPHRTLAELCTVMERDYQLERDNHIPNQRGAAARAADMERHSGVESLVGWIKRECLEEIRGATSWSDLHQTLSDHGLALRSQGAGFVIQSNDGTTTRASTVARDLSKRSLEKRLGPFAPALATDAVANPAQRQYRKEPLPLRVSTTELYAQYKADQQHLTTARRSALDKLRRERDRQIAAAKRSAHLRRAATKLVGEGRANKKTLYAQASAALRAELDTINKHYVAKRDALYTEHSRRTWADWLKHQARQGHAGALAALRARDATSALTGETLGSVGPGHGTPSAVVDNVTKHGTIIYRAGETAVRDDGDRLQVSRGATPAGLQAALRLAMDKYGSTITVHGSTEFKAAVIRAAATSRLPLTFADPQLESRRLTLLNKEHAHDRPPPTARTANTANEPRGRLGRGTSRSGGVGTDGTPTASRAAAGTSQPRHDGGATTQRKPNVGRVGRVPPPQSQHRLRTLSQLGVVRIAGGTEMLLPRDVPRNLEHQRTQPADSLRRPVSGGGERPVTGETGEGRGAAAIAKYVAERQAKRRAGIDIPDYSGYTPSHAGVLNVVGTRTIDGVRLVLLAREEADARTIFVAAPSPSTQFRTGDVVSATPDGAMQRISRRNRSR